MVARLAEMESPRYDLIRQKLEGLGYVISGELYNTADYGLPQQRRRAWLLCIIKAELATSEEQLANDMRLFMRRNVPLSACVDLSAKVSKKSGSKKANLDQRGAKWKDGFDEMCGIFGKAWWQLY